MFTLNQAAKEAGKSKQTILDAIRGGRLSAPKDEQGRYQINPAELFMVYPASVNLTTQTERDATPQDATLLRAELAILKEERERERGQMQETIKDLRDRLKAESDERRQLLRLLPPPQTAHDSPASPAQASASRWAARPWFVAALVLACLGAVAALLVCHHRERRPPTLHPLRSGLTRRATTRKATR